MFTDANGFVSTNKFTRQNDRIALDNIFHRMYQQLRMYQQRRRLRTTTQRIITQFINRASIIMHSSNTGPR